MRKTTTNLHNPLIDKLGDLNPQLFRELKGKLKPRNVTVAIAISTIGQTLIYLFYQSLLPESKDVINRYCTGNGYNYYDPSSTPECLHDSFGNFIINWQLWWADLFLCMSIIGIFALLVGGTYMLVADLSREESRETLDFIRLSPQSAKTILIGKILGVPVLLYLLGALALPLHLGSGIAVGIPLGLILTFYGVLIASCAFFYSAALLYGLVSSGLVGFKPWLGSGMVLFFLYSSTALLMNGYISYISKSSLDWLILFNPTMVLFYLVDGIKFFTIGSFGYFRIDNLKEHLWYFQPLWNEASIAISFLLLNYSLWTYWIWRGLVRRFHNPNATVLSKQQSYWVSGCFAVMNLGFALQSTESSARFDSYLLFQFCLSIFFLGLIAALSPHRQALQDWARYRHQTSAESRSLIQDLIWGEKSPSTVAIALNLSITTACILLSLVLSPVGSRTTAVLIGLILSASVILIYAAIVQMILFMRTPKRAIWAWTTISTLIILPPVCLALFNLTPSEVPGFWLFSLLPAIATENASNSTVLLAILGQWLAIALLGLNMTRQLQKAGESETKTLLSGGKR